MSKTYELSYTAERIDEMLKEVDEHTIYSDATTEERGLMSATDKSKLDALPTAQQIEGSLSEKVDKVEGKGLSENDYTDAEKESVASAYHKPQNGIPKTDLDSSVQTSLGKADTALQSFTETDPTVPSWAKQPNKPSYNYSEIGNTPDLSGFITKSVNDLTNYYLKSETYTKAEVAALIGAIQQFHYEIYQTLPSSGQSNVLYLIGPTGSGSDRYEEYVYANNDFTKIGDTSIDLSGYVTTSALNTALASYTPTSELAAVATSGSYNDLTNKPSIPDISGKADKVNNATNGNFAGLDANGNLTDSGKKESDFATSSQGAKADTAYQKPSSGIPESDLSSDVQQALQKHFKGWWPDLATLKAAITAVPGDYAYVKGATSSDPATIYECTIAGTWSDSGRTADTSNVQTFASGEEVNEVHIINDLTTGGADDVLSAEQGMVLNQRIIGRDKYDKYTANSSWKTTTFTLEMRGGRKVKLTNLADSGFSSHSISIYYNSPSAGTRLYTELTLSNFPFEFILPFDVDSILVSDGGTATTPNQTWQLEYQDDVIGLLPELDTYTRSEIEGSEKSLFFKKISGVIAASVDVGDSISFESNVYRSVYRADITGLYGNVKIDKILSKGNNNNVAICDSDNIIIALLSHSTRADATQTITIDLSAYQNAAYIYAVGSSTDAVIFTNYTIGLQRQLKEINTLPQKGGLLLHFDGSINPEDPRLDIIADYGFKVSWCISPATFSGTGRFSGDWTSEGHRQLYWNLISSGADIGIYPSVTKTTEAEWDEWFESAVANLAAKGIYNITTIHCGKLVVNDALLASAPKYGFHVLRGGGFPADGDTYTYTEDNMLVPIKTSPSTLYVLKSGIIDSTSKCRQNLNDRLGKAIEQNKVYSVFAHGIGTGTTDISEEAFRAAMDVVAANVEKGLVLLNWREFYRMLNPIDGSSNDYLRLLKMARQ